MDYGTEGNKEQPVPESSEPAMQLGDVMDSISQYQEAASGDTCDEIKETNEPTNANIQLQQDLLSSDTDVMKASSYIQASAELPEDIVQGENQQLIEPETPSNEDNRIDSKNQIVLHTTDGDGNPIEMSSKPEDNDAAETESETKLVLHSDPADQDITESLGERASASNNQSVPIESGDNNLVLYSEENVTDINDPNVQQSPHTEKKIKQEKFAEATQSKENEACEERDVALTSPHKDNDETNKENKTNQEKAHEEVDIKSWIKPRKARAKAAPPGTSIGRTQYMCSVCDKRGELKTELEQHIAESEECKDGHVLVLVVRTPLVADKNKEKEGATKDGSKDDDLVYSIKQLACTWPKCGQIFTDPVLLKEHKRTHTATTDIMRKKPNDRRFSDQHIKCNKCQVVCNGRLGYRKHMRLHGINMDSDEEEEIQTFQFTCPVCSKGFSNEDAFTKHAQKDHGLEVIVESGSPVTPKRKQIKKPKLEPTYEIQESPYIPKSKFRVMRAYPKAITKTGARKRRVEDPNEIFDDSEIFVHTLTLPPLITKATVSRDVEKTGGSGDAKDNRLVITLMPNSMETNSPEKPTEEPNMPQQEEREFKCIICNLVFPQSKLLVQHAKTHDLGSDAGGVQRLTTVSIEDVGPIQCNFCSRRCTTEKDLEEHIQLAHGQGQHEQKISIQLVEDNKQTMAQLVVLDVSGPKACVKIQGDPNAPVNTSSTELDRGLLDPNEIVVYNRVSNPKGREREEFRYPCSHCSRAFPFRIMLKRHEIAEHGVNTSLRTIDSNDIEPERLLYDPVATATEYGEVVYRNKRFNTVDRETKLLALKSFTPVNGVYTCTLCEGNFRTNKDLGRHMAFKHDVRQFACAECGAEFARKGHLKRHMVNIHFMTQDELDDVFPVHTPSQCVSKVHSLMRQRRKCGLIQNKHPIRPKKKRVLRPQDRVEGRLGRRPVYKPRQLLEKASDRELEEDLKKRNHVCKVCQQVFPSKDSLMIHVVAVHNMTAATYDQLKVYTTIKKTTPPPAAPKRIKRERRTRSPDNYTESHVRILQRDAASPEVAEESSSSSPERKKKAPVSATKKKTTPVAKKTAAESRTPPSRGAKKRFVCPECGRRFKLRQQVKQHMKQHYPSSDSEPADEGRASEEGASSIEEQDGQFELLREIKQEDLTDELRELWANLNEVN